MPARARSSFCVSKGGYPVFAERFYVGRFEPGTVISTKNVLETHDQRGPEPYQMHPLPQEIADRAVFFGIDVSLGKYSQPQHLGEPESIALIVGNFSPSYFLIADGFARYT